MNKSQASVFTWNMRETARTERNWTEQMCAVGTEDVHKCAVLLRAYQVRGAALSRYYRSAIKHLAFSKSQEQPNMYLDFPETKNFQQFHTFSHCGNSLTFVSFPSLLWLSVPSVGVFPSLFSPPHPVSRFLSLSVCIS